MEKNQGENEITVLFFIGLVDELGLEKLVIKLSDNNQRVADVIQQLAQKGEEWKEALDPERLTITVNKQFSTVDQKLFNGDKVAFVPKA